MTDPARRDDEQDEPSRLNFRFRSQWLNLQLSAAGKVAWILLVAILTGSVLSALVRALYLHLTGEGQ